MKILRLCIGASALSVLILASFLLACEKPEDKADARPTPLPTPVDGLWTRNPWAKPMSAVDPDIEKKMRELEALGYTGGTEPMPAVSGVITYDPKRAYNGYTMVLSSHDTEARLINMRGQTLHTWKFDSSTPWTTFEPAEGNPIAGEDNNFEMRRYFHRVKLYPNGDLLAMLYAFGLLKLDKDSNVLWRTPGPVHHDFDVTPDGTIYSLYRLAGMMPEIHPTELVLDEFVAIYSPEGELKRKVSILSAMKNSDYAPALKTVPYYGEIYHSNAVRVLDGRFADRNPAFKAGNVLTSLRHANMVAIVDTETEKMVWALTSLWYAQHDPRLTDSGTMTVFDNRGVAIYTPGHPKHVGSRVIEINPFTQEIVWVFTGSNETQLWSDLASGALRLPNGNTFINETRRGRYLEVTPDKQVVWEYINPHQTGPNLEFIADLYDVLRYPPDLPLDWLPGERPSPEGEAPPEAPQEETAHRAPPAE